MHFCYLFKKFLSLTFLEVLLLLFSNSPWWYIFSSVSLWPFTSLLCLLVSIEKLAKCAWFTQFQNSKMSKVHFKLKRSPFLNICTLRQLSTFSWRLDLGHDGKISKAEFAACKQVIEKVSSSFFVLENWPDSDDFLFLCRIYLSLSPPLHFSLS